MRALQKLTLTVAVGLTGALLAACAPGAGDDSDSGKTQLTVACYAGTYVDMFKKEIFPKFAEENDVEFNYIPGISTETITKLQAQKSDPKIDLACIDTGPKSSANEMGLLAKNDPDLTPNLEHLVDYAKDPDDIGMMWGTLTVGIAYDKEALEKKDIAPPTSWVDLADARFKDQVVMATINGTYGVFSLVMMANAKGGGVDDIDPGFAVAKQVRQNAVAISPKADLSDYFEQGEASVGIWTDAETLAFDQSYDYPMGFVYPSDGAPIIGATMSVVEGSDDADMAQRFINYLASPEAQEIIARIAKFRPTVDNVTLSDEVKKDIMYDEAKNLVQPDYAAIEDKRAEWVKRWNREIS